MAVPTIAVKLTNQQVADAVALYLAQQGMDCTSVVYDLQGFWANSGVEVVGVTAHVTVKGGK